MRTPTIVAFEATLDGQMRVKLQASPNNIQQIGMTDPFEWTEVPGATAANRGAALLTALRRHVAVKAGLDLVLSSAPDAGSSPLYFHVRAAAADALPWEQIWVDDRTGFCALDRRWPVVRIADEEREVEVRGFMPPLRIVAVLSAAGERMSGVPQLRGLLNAMSVPEAAAIGVTLHVISGEEEVLDAARDAGVRADWIMPDPPGLARQITAANPDILHVLCHGDAGVANVRSLAFGHLGDFDAVAVGTATTGSVRLTVQALLDALRKCKPWLVVLSACETAAAATGDVQRALAHDLVSGGIPAVIGMRRLVDITMADRFCGALYPEVLATVAAALGDVDNPTETRDVSWAEVLTAPRNVLSGGNPPVGDSWTDPVLYVQVRRLQVQPFAPQPPAEEPSSPQPAPEEPAAVEPATEEPSAVDLAALRGKLDKFRGLVATLDPATTDPDMLTNAQARIDELERMLGR